MDLHSLLGSYGGNDVPWEMEHQKQEIIGELRQR